MITNQMAYYGTWGLLALLLLGILYLYIVMRVNRKRKDLNEVSMPDLFQTGEQDKVERGIPLAVAEMPVYDPADNSRKARRAREESSARSTRAQDSENKFFGDEDDFKLGL